MIREPYVGNLEAVHGNAFLVQHEVQFLARRPARVGRQTVGVGRFQSGRPLEQVDLVLAPERVEVTGNDDGLLRSLDQVMQAPELQVPVAVPTQLAAPSPTQSLSTWDSLSA